MTQHLLDQPQAAQQPVTLPAFSGAILGLQGDVLHGWAMDNAQPEQRLAIEVFVDGASVALVRADQYEPQASAGDQYHGFVVQLRQNWLDEARVITAQVANQGFSLEGQILLPTAPSQDSASIASQVWHTGGLRVGGWCWDPQAPRRHVQVTVREGNQVVGQGTCNVHNQALAYRATSDHGFAIDLPWELADGKVHILDVVNDLGQPLAGSPIRLCCWPEGVEGLIRKLDPTQDKATLELLTAVANEQSLRLPKSAGWESYPQWFEAFQRLDEKDSPALQGKLGLLLVSEGDAALEQTSLESLAANRADIHEVATAPSADLAPALGRLLSAGCDRILPIHAGDRLAPFALPHLSALLDDGTAWAFADCDRDGPQGERSLPWLKPVWDIDLFIGADIYTPGAIFRSEILIQALAKLASRIESSKVNWHDLLASVAFMSQVTEAKVLHLPRIAYHRSVDTPISPEMAEASADRLIAIEWLCQQLDSSATVSRLPIYPSLLRVHWPLPKKLPKVSLIVPTRDQFRLLQACIEGLLSKTEYPNLEIIVVDNQTTDPETLNYLEHIKSRGVIVLPHPYPFNYSSINNRAVKHASGDLIGLINNDIEITHNDWLQEMVSRLLRPNVGAVGAKLIWPNSMVQHGGVVVGINGLAAHSGNNLQDLDAGYLGFNQLARCQSAVTAACLLTYKKTYEEQGGLDELSFPVAFNDVDYCMRLRKADLKITWTPFAKLIHAESASRGKDDKKEKRARAEREQDNFISQWTKDGFMDEFYHPAISHDYLTGPYGGLALALSNTGALDPRS
ncbi:glycosyltransferase [Pantoea sp. Tr-811]|uniref:glycosyltransferase family 2 protein n=1 Tax=Pantoea sp. Tr-811 TaxID=2608361 RepID=UPI0014226C30|nr:glycosyltransferase [Pantoea sp. Tr-811]NIF29807.1 glycosyltransferase [Pantoea sp. Tr-811]